MKMHIGVILKDAVILTRLRDYFHLSVLSGEIAK